MRNRLCVGNIASSITHVSLEPAFAAAGQVREVEYPTDRETPPRDHRLLHPMFAKNNCQWLGLSVVMTLSVGCGDGDDGNVVYMVRIGPCCSNSIFYVS
jgi:hypothetical protein